MTKYNLDLIIGQKIVLNCRTEEELNIFVDILNIYLENKQKKQTNRKSYIFNPNLCYCISNTELYISDINWYKSQDYKICNLDDIKIIENLNNFTEYNFLETDIKGKIFDFIDDNYIGYIIKLNNEKQLVYWTVEGECFNPFNMISYSNYNLEPIKKEWFEDEENFEKYKGKLITNKYGNIRKIQSIDNSKVSTAEQNLYHDIIKNEEWKPLTKEEINDLII